MARRPWTDAEARVGIAFWLIGIGMFGIVVVSVVAISFASTDTRPEMARLVFVSVLPLLGTWIGTVLAFYFAKDNLQAASQTTLDALKLVGTFSEDTPVEQVMTPLSKMNPVRRVANLDDADKLVLSELHASIRATQNSRVPILNNGEIALLIIHEPDIDKYAQSRPVRVESLTADDTVGALRAIPELRAAVGRFVVVPRTATLAQARQKMQEVPECKDLFVTHNGERGGKVVGWLTNSDLARND